MSFGALIGRQCNNAYLRFITSAHVLFEALYYEYFCKECASLGPKQTQRKDVWKFFTTELGEPFVKTVSMM